MEAMSTYVLSLNEAPKAEKKMTILGELVAVKQCLFDLRSEQKPVRVVKERTVLASVKDGKGRDRLTNRVIREVEVSGGERWTEIRADLDQHIRNLVVLGVPVKDGKVDATLMNDAWALYKWKHLGDGAMVTIDARRHIYMPAVEFYSAKFEQGFRAPARREKKA